MHPSSPLFLHTQKIFLVLLLLLRTLIYADNATNDDCNNEEIISQLNNKTTPASHIENGSVNRSNDKYDYYKFKAGMDGNINISLKMSSLHNSIIVGSSCGEDNYYSNASDSDTKTAPSFFVTAGSTVHIRVEGRHKPLIGTRTLNYKLKISIDDSNISENQRSFALRNPVNTRNILGDYQVIGNSVLCAKNILSGECYNYTASILSNTSLVMKYIDVDTDATTFNSSQAKLNIPADARVKWAAIYAQGHIFYEYKNAAIEKLNEPIKISVPNVAPINSTPKQIDLYRSGAVFGFTYSTYSDIAELVGKKGSDINGMVTVANVKANKDGVNTSFLGRFGAWALVVIYEDQSSSLKNISVFDGYRVIKDEAGFNDSVINIDGFITPTNGEIVSRTSIFVGEGDRTTIGDRISTGDRLYFNNSEIGNKNNAFYSHITDDIVRNPSYSNNLGIDIQTFNIGTNGLNLVKNGDHSAKIKFSTRDNLLPSDEYFPSLAIFSTNLYEPRVCYRQEFFDENKNPIEDIKVGDTITVQAWISNMKKDFEDLILEPADKVEITVELDDKNIKYIPASIKMQNVYEADFTSKTDNQGDDLAEFLSATNTAKYRVGTGASSTDGGKLTPNYTASNSNKAFVTFQAKVLQTGDININNIYKVSYENPQIGVRFGDESPINISLCSDINTSLGVKGVLGEFNIVNNEGGDGDYSDPKSSKTSLKTQVVNRPFNAKIISLNENKSALKSFEGEIKVSLIENPYSSEDSDAIKQEKCDGAISISDTKNINFNGTIKTESFNYNKATRAALFKISFEEDGEIKYACSLDSFALRPDKFVLSKPAGKNINLLTSAQIYEFPLIASQYGGTTPTPSYNISAANNNFIVLGKTLYAPNGDIREDLKGSLLLASTPFTIINGQADVGITFTDVAMVNINIIDKAWAFVDIANEDTDESCGGAWICGDIDATFIPSHFEFTKATLHNHQDSSFTYLSSDLNVSAPFSITLEAKNSKGVKTENFDKNSWEKPVSISASIPTTIETMVVEPNVKQINNQIVKEKLGFQSGELAIDYYEENASKQLFFNLNRAVDAPVNPFLVRGSDINLTALSTYSANADTAEVKATQVADNNATFIYGRTNASRQRYRDNSGIAFIYYESYCFGEGCDKSLLPDGVDSKNTNDLRWFVNSKHNTLSDGNITSDALFEKANTFVTENILHRDESVPHISAVKLTYDSSQRGYPYKTTMLNSASSWLIYNQNDTSATTNEFPVEFSIKGEDWSGKHETSTTTKDHNVTNTNRRSMW